jgi:hypothetical protein
VLGILQGAHQRSMMAANRVIARDQAQQLRHQHVAIATCRLASIAAQASSGGHQYLDWLPSHLRWHMFQ